MDSVWIIVIICFGVLVFLLIILFLVWLLRRIYFRFPLKSDLPENRNASIITFPDALDKDLDTKSTFLTIKISKDEDHLHNSILSTEILINDVKNFQQQDERLATVIQIEERDLDTSFSNGNRNHSVPIFPKLYKDALLSPAPSFNHTPIVQIKNPQTRKQNKNKRRNQKRAYLPQFRKKPRYNFGQKTIIIATDATPRHIGGYIINQFSNKVEYYSTPSSSMPWILRNRTRGGNPTEFEMKNLLCALILWEPLIVRFRRVAIFTDNSAIIGNNIYGSRVRSFIYHLENCKNVVQINPTWSFVNSRERRELFEEFIIPADLLSRENENDFVSHFETQNNVQSINFNTAVRHKIIAWTKNPCVNCGFGISRVGSFKKTIR